MANINIRLNKNFTTQYNKMLTEYGEEFAKLNGFADSQLSYTDFIDNFVDAQTVADSSIDGSANVKDKDARTLMNEMPKPHRKLLAFNKIFFYDFRYLLDGGFLFFGVFERLSGECVNKCDGFFLCHALYLHFVKNLDKKYKILYNFLTFCIIFYYIRKHESERV